MKTLKALKHAKMRALAGMIYVGHPTGITIEEIHKDPRFNKVALRTLERWAKLDEWVARRVNFIEEWKAEARKRLAGQLAQARIDELETLAEIVGAGIQKIREDVVAPKSLEGVMRATVDALKYKDELRSRIGESVIVEAGTSGLPQELPADMTEEAAAAAARAALMARRQSLAAPSLQKAGMLQSLDAITDLTNQIIELRPEAPAASPEGSGEDPDDRDYGTSDEGRAGQGIRGEEVETEVSEFEAQFESVEGS